MLKFKFNERTSVAYTNGNAQAQPPSPKRVDRLRPTGNTSSFASNVASVRPSTVSNDSGAGDRQDDVTDVSPEERIAALTSLTLYDKRPAYYGSIKFKESVVDNGGPARYACLSSKTSADKVLKVLTDAWKQKKPSVLLSVSGSAQDMRLDPYLKDLFTRGLASAARCTDAWVFTGGTDTGVMELAGSALAGQSGRTPCIGFASWKMISHRDVLKRRGEERNYRKLTANSSKSAALDKNHTHFFLVDNGSDEWGAEIALRADVEEELQKQNVPLVLLVLGGGPNTVDQVVASAIAGAQVLLVKESGGFALAMAEFFEPLLVRC